MSFSNITLLLVSFLGAIYDLKARRVPNWLTLGTFILVLLYNLILFNWNGLLISLSGFFVGILLLLIPYLMGGMGAGDVKLLGTLGALTSYKSVISIFLYSAICGLVLGIIWIIFTPGHFKFLITTGQILPAVDKKQKVPYAIAIFLGITLYIVFGPKNLFNIPIWQ